MRPLLSLLSAALLSACGTPAPPGIDPASPRYQTDQASCDKSVPETINKQNAKRALTWFASSVTRWSQIDDGVNACMQSKGWSVARPCTEDERRHGNQPGTLIVTARGITCTEPGKPS